MTIHAFGDRVPQFGADAFVHVDATVIGDVILEEGVTVWPSAVLRGDVERIVIGSFTSFQDGAIAHADPGTPLRVGSSCTVGHGAVLHGCTVGDGCLIGMHATLLNGCEVGEHSIVAAHALVPQDRLYPARSLLVGAPARVVRGLSDKEIDHITRVRGRYAARGKLYSAQGFGADLSPFPAAASPDAD
jgi:carbonic anhydrase/acetyltransferase-like protein (isoleucine patch superfamily)